MSLARSHRCQTSVLRPRLTIDDYWSFRSWLHLCFRKSHSLPVVRTRRHRTWDRLSQFQPERNRHSKGSTADLPQPPVLPLFKTLRCCWWNTQAEGITYWTYILPDRIGQQNGVKKASRRGRGNESIQFLSVSRNSRIHGNPGISGAQETVDDIARGFKPRQRLQRDSDTNTATRNGATSSKKAIYSCKAS